MMGDLTQQHFEDDLTECAPEPHSTATSGDIDLPRGLLSRPQERRESPKGWYVRSCAPGANAPSTQPCPGRSPDEPILPERASSLRRLRLFWCAKWSMVPPRWCLRKETTAVAETSIRRDQADVQREAGTSRRPMSGILVRRGPVGVMAAAVALVVLGVAPVAYSAVASTVEAPGAPGGGSSWTTGDKVAIGTAAASASRVWFTVAKGVTTEVFYPRADVANVQDMQYVVSDGSTFVDLERDATTHVVAMPDEKALEYTVTNTANNGRYRLTNTYVTDPARPTLQVRTRFESLDGGAYQLYVLYNPSLAGGGLNDSGGWDAANGALVASDSQAVFGSPLSVATALKASVGFVKHSTGY